MLWQDGVTREPFRISIILARHHTRKFKREDSERTIHRIEWLVKNFEAPKGGLIASFYIADEMHSWVDSGFSTHSLWKLRTTWKGEGDYVTLQVPEGSWEVGNEWKQKNMKGLLHRIDTLSLIYGFQVKNIDYTMSYEEVKNLLVNTKMHFSYIGASYFVAALMRVPTLGLGLEKEKRKSSIPKGPNQREPVELWRNLFCSSQNGEGHMIQVTDDITVINKPVTTVYDTSSVEDVDKEFQRLIR